MDKDWLDDGSKIVGIAASLGLVAAVKWGHKKINMHLLKRKNQIEANEAVMQMLPALTELSKVIPLIKDIAYQFSNNGGTNFKGLIDDIRNNQKLIMQSTRIFQNMNGLSYWESDSEGKCIYASNAMCEMVGRSQSEMLDNNWAGYVERSVFEYWHYTIENNIIFDMEYSFLMKDGSILPVRGKAEHKYINGKYAGSLGHLTLVVINE